MDDKVLRLELDDLHRGIDRVERRLEPRFSLEKGVQHSLVWGIVVMFLAVMLYLIVKMVH